jgi:photosystem II stability/assembly factor-like uncharacterized protein
MLVAGCVSSPPTQPTPGARPSPSPTHIQLPTSAQIAAPAPDVAWIIVGQAALFVSVDRSLTWKQRLLPPAADLAGATITFVNDREGWLVTTGSVTSQCASQSVTIWHTADGASTWHQLSSLGMSSERCKSGLSFTDSKHGFLAAWDLDRSPIIYRTADGGKTWSPSDPIPDPPGVSFVGGLAMQPELVRSFGQDLLVSTTGITSTGSCQRKLASPGPCVRRTFVFASADGGATWSFLAPAHYDGEPVGMVTDSRWLQIPAQGQAFETSDSGRSWHAFACDYAQYVVEAPELVFGDDVFGYATAQGGLQKTLDGGAHWIPIQTPGT